MTYLNKVKYMPPDQYSAELDTEDSICAVEVSQLFSSGLFPDWSKKIILSFNTLYNVGSGVLASYKVGYVWCGASNWVGRNCTINGITFQAGGWYTEDGHDSKLIFFPVSTGDTFRANAGTNLIFLPAVWGG